MSYKLASVLTIGYLTLSLGLSNNACNALALSSIEGYLFLSLILDF